MLMILFKYMIIALVFFIVLLAGHHLVNLTLNRKKNIDRRLTKALERRHSTKPANMIAKEEQRIKMISLLAGLAIGFFIAGVHPINGNNVIAAVLLGSLGFLWPKVYLILYQQKRLKQLEMQLPDLLELIVNSMKAGLSLGQSLEMAAQDSPKPMAEEITKVVRDHRLGLSAEEALERMWRRWPNSDFELFVTAAGVSLRTGSNLAEVSQGLIATIRERFRLKARVKTLTAQGKLSGWIVGLLPLVLVVGFIGLEPKMMNNFFSHPIGLLLVALCVVLEVLGAFFISKIAHIHI